MKQFPKIDNLRPGEILKSDKQGEFSIKGGVQAWEFDQIIELMSPSKLAKGQVLVGGINVTLPPNLQGI